MDNASSATLNRFLTSGGGLNRGNSLKGTVTDSPTSNSTAAQLTNGAENLANEMSTLMHDYEIMSRINDLVGQLKSEYAGINLDMTRNALNTIQTSIKKKDEEMTLVDSCCLQLIVKQKSGKEETFTFRTDSPDVKTEWITELRLAQLSLDPNNSFAWEMTDSVQHRSLTNFPLFVRMHPVHRSSQHQIEVSKFQVCGNFEFITEFSNFSGPLRMLLLHVERIEISQSDQKQILSVGVFSGRLQFSCQRYDASAQSTSIQWHD